MTKCILPWFGGGPAVWTTCLLFFQVALLGGYAYAHLASTRLSRRQQILLHVSLLGAAVLALPIHPDPSWKPIDPEHPTRRILILMAATVGLPYFVLSATAPLLQKWASLARPGGTPYRMYALSNFGSLLALVTYPTLVEPALTSRSQSIGWSGLFIVFAGLCAACAISGWKTAPNRGTESGEPATVETPERPSLAARLIWLALAANGSMLLLAVTNQICQDIATVPFLWILPLSLYLVTFVITFDNDRWYRRSIFWTLEVLGAWAMAVILVKSADASLLAQIAIFSLGLFAGCMVSHGELVRLKPSSRHLTEFYLTVASGGALGAIFVTLIAPQIFPSYLELHLAIWSTFVVALIAFLNTAPSRPGIRKRRGTMVSLIGGALGVVALNVALTYDALSELGDFKLTVRNFYGVLRIGEYEPDSPLNDHVALLHGHIFHGWQFVAASRRRVPTSYYGDASGVGLALRYYPRSSPLKIGAVGLGTGTVAAYGQTGDRYRFYEINPNVEWLARNAFTFLADSAAEWEVVPGDARLSLEREPRQAFDVLILDAFNGDSIPVHLLTREAFAVYRRHLKPEGVIAVHITNRHLDLRPVVWAAAEGLGLRAVLIDSPGDPDGVVTGARWVLVTNNESFLNRPEIQAAVSLTAMPTRRRGWTDTHSDLFTILNW